MAATSFSKFEGSISVGYYIVALLDCGDLGYDGQSRRLVCPQIFSAHLALLAVHAPVKFKSHCCLDFGHYYISKYCTVQYCIAIGRA